MNIDILIDEIYSAVVNSPAGFHLTPHKTAIYSAIHNTLKGKLVFTPEELKSYEEKDSEVKGI